MISVKQIVGSVIGIVIAVAMIPVINSIITDANLTGIQATLVALIPYAFIGGIVVLAVDAFMK